MLFLVTMPPPGVGSTCDVHAARPCPPTEPSDAPGVPHAGVVALVSPRMEPNGQGGCSCHRGLGGAAPSTNRP
jgi:hypothetical protein